VNLVTISNLTCPLCGHREAVRMPARACQFFHECSACHQVFRPKPGDCCVFCSYGDVRCPPRQTTVVGACSAHQIGSLRLA
jgi:hypothetical protein